MSENEYKKQLVKAYRGLSDDDQHDDDTGTESGGSRTGSTGAGYVDFLSTSSQINDQDIPGDKLNHLERTHDPKTKILIEQQKAERDKVQKIKEGKELPRGLGNENENPFQPHPVLIEASQFHGMTDSTVSPIPGQSDDQDANPELRKTYDLRPQLQYAPSHTPTPHFNPRPTPR